MSAHLPQLKGPLFLTDGGLETTLIFHHGIELPHFAAFVLLGDRDGRALLRQYYESYLRIAADQGAGFILEAPTWRANPDWAPKLGLDQADLDRLNADAIALMLELRAAWAGRVPRIVVSGCIGPRGDGYDPGEEMSAQEAAAYHWRQIAAFARSGADMACAITMTNAPEAVGVVRAAQAANLPVAISFTVETDGRLPTGQGLGAAIEAVDAATDAGAAYFMVNCAHPSHFEDALAAGGGWVQRIGGLRANASRRSHQELNEAPDLDDGNPAELGRENARLVRRHPRIRVLGGCCGADCRHVAAMARACMAVDA